MIIFNRIQQRYLQDTYKIGNPYFFITLYYNGSPYICDSRVGYSAGGYSLSPRWLLT